MNGSLGREVRATFRIWARLDLVLAAVERLADLSTAADRGRTICLSRRRIGRVTTLGWSRSKGISAADRRLRV